METIKNMISPEFAKALVKFRAEVKNASKDATNPFFKSKYADLASVIEAIREPMANSGLTYFQRTHESLEAPDAAIIETYIIHESGESLPGGRVFVMPTKRDPQGFGSAMTYARRYSLITAVGIATEDDDGNEASRVPVVNSQQKTLRVPKEPDTDGAELAHEMAQSTEPDSYFWYAFPEKLNKEQKEFLKSKNCLRDDSQGLWFCPTELGGKREGYRTECPYPGTDEGKTTDNEEEENELA